MKRQVSELGNCHLPVEINWQLPNSPQTSLLTIVGVQGNNDFGKLFPLQF